MLSSHKLKPGDKLRCIKITPNDWFDGMLPGNMYNIHAAFSSSYTIIGENKNGVLYFTEEEIEEYFKLPGIYMIKEYVDVKLP